MSIILPPREVFEVDPESVPVDDTERIAKKGYGFGGWIKTVCPPEGGMYAHYEGMLKPYKGHPWAQAVEANNHLKRLTLLSVVPFARKEMILPGIGFILLPWKKKISWLENWLENYYRLFELVMWRYVLQESYYNNCSRGLWKLTYLFLCNIGISEDLAYRTGKIIATLIEWDDAYRLPIEDIFSETTKEKMLADPQTEIKTMIKLLGQRANFNSAGKFEAFGKLLSIILYVPRIKKAFVKAIAEVNFEQLQLDEIDYYHILFRNDYNFLGREVEDRLKERQGIEAAARIVLANH